MKLTRSDIAGRKTTGATHFRMGRGQSFWLYGAGGVPRLGAKEDRHGRHWAVDGKYVRDLDAALAVINGDMTLEEATKMPKPTISLQGQIQEAEYEIGMRVDVYPRLVKSGKMKQELADMHLERMRAIHTTLLWFQANEQTIRDAIAAKKKPTEPPQESAA